jgi:hypothetical protein
MTIKTDFSGGLNSDVAPQKLQPTDYMNLQNMRMGSTDKGRTGQMESIGSSLLVTNPYLLPTSPYGTSLCNGSVEDNARQRFYQFVWNQTGYHAIYCYDGTTVYKVLLDAQVEGGLNLDKDFYIHSAEVVGNLLIWTDNNQEQKCINVEAGIKLNHSSYVTTEAAYATPIKYTTTTLIKRPPIFPLTWAKSTDAGYPNNFIAKNAYQFSYRYRYRDYQNSVLSTYSRLVSFNGNSETFNKITVTVPTTEYIDDDIFAIDVCVKYGNFGKTFIVKSWDKTSDTAAITAHNAGTALSFGFYDDLSGIALDDVSANTPFDSVPLLSETLSVAKNRIFLGHNLFGYNTPSASSLGVTVQTFDTGGSGSYAGRYKDMNLKYYYPDAPSVLIDKSLPYVYVATLATSSYYYGPMVGGTSLNASDAITSWNTEINLAYYIIRNNVNVPAGALWSYSSVTFTDLGPDCTIIVAAPTSSLLQFFKSNSTYRTSIAFYDRFRRKCGIVKNYISSTIPVRTYNQSVFSSILAWTLSNAGALTEIPDWAYYYQIQITKNQTTRFFEQINSPKSSYVTKSTSGVLTYNQTTWAINTNYAVSFDLTQLISNGLGYTYNDGDFLIIYKSDGTSVTIPVLGTDGNNVLCHPTDVGDLTGTVQFLVEIYTPYKASVTEPFYETGDVMPILLPGTSSRTYSSLSGQINGDCYAFERNNGASVYFVEAMSPNDLVWQIWQTDSGWPNEVDSIGQKLIKGSIAFSDTYIEGTKVNGLGSFQPLNTDNISIENGALRKLILTSKTKAEGSIMLAICENKTLSVYLGESVLTSATGENTAIAQSSNTIGQINPLKGGYGTINPESVVEYRGGVFWFDANAGCWAFYSSSGVHSLNKGRTERFAKLYSDQYKSLTSAEIEALGNRPLIIGGVDIYHKEMLWSIPKIGDNPNGTIADISMDYPYDLLDFQGKTIVLKGEFVGMRSYGTEYFSFQGAFMGSYSFNAESFISIANKLFYFNAGNIYQCNQTSLYNNFSGVQQKARIMFAINAEPSKPKVLSAISVEANVSPDYVHFRTEYPDIQSSDFVTADFTEKEGIFYASALRDRLSPNSAGTYDEKLFTGDKLRGTYVYVLIEFWTSSIVQLKAVNVSFVDSIGHRV